MILKYIKGGAVELARYSIYTKKNNDSNTFYNSTFIQFFTKRLP